MSDQLSFDGDYEDLWKRVRDELAARLSRAQHTTFVRPLTLEVRGQDSLALKGSRFTIEGLTRYGLTGLIQQLFDECAGYKVKIEFVMVPVERAAPTPGVPPAKESADFPLPPETFDNFVVGRSNELAFNAARRVALDPGKQYNPLFIFGASGLGKTHLLRAVLNDVRRLHASLVVRYMTAQEFSEEFIHALQHGRIHTFRSKTRSVDVWLLDDIQFLERREKTQEEMYHAFNHLHQEGKQIVIAADRAPRLLFAMDERMRSRFEGGLLADISPPETETRIRILEGIAAREAVQIPYEVIEWIAVTGSTNVRTLIGAFNRVVAVASMSSQCIDIDLAQRVLGEHFATTSESSRLTGDQILDACCGHYGIPRGQLLGKSRVKNVADARHVAMFLMREEAGESFAAIGRRFDRHHSSVLHAVEKVKAQVKSDVVLANDVKCIRRELGLD